METNLKSKKFWLVVVWMLIGSGRMFLTGFDRWANISSEELAIFLSLSGLIGAYLGVNYFVKKLRNGNELKNAST